jgi:Xaa-Pro aminopeptidase
MKEHNIDGVIISGTDPHQSENAPMHWRTREWITGFWAVNGTNGTAVVTQDKALCWTDSRYFIQAEEQLQGTGFEMMKEDGPEAVDLVEWVAENMPQNSVLGIDGTTFSISVAKQIEDSISKKEIKFVTNTQMEIISIIQY